jgi:hypothetical protein
MKRSKDLAEKGIRREDHLNGSDKGSSSAKSSSRSGAARLSGGSEADLHSSRVGGDSQNGFYTSSYKSRSLNVAPTDDKNRRKKHDDDRWEMRKN